jgi:putative membrane protein
MHFIRKSTQRELSICRAIDREGLAAGRDECDLTEPLQRREERHVACVRGNAASIGASHVEHVWRGVAQPARRQESGSIKEDLPVWSGALVTAHWFTGVRAPMPGAGLALRGVCDGTMLTQRNCTHHRSDLRRRSARAWTFIVLALAAPLACAHTEGRISVLSAAEVWLAAALFFSGLLYARGVYLLARAARSHRTHVIHCTVMFTLGWSTLALAFVSPLAGAIQGVFSAHMVQHELVMVIAAPLMVLGRPLAIWTWAMPLPWRRVLARPFREPAVRRAWRFISAPVAASALHAAAIWVWHVPSLFERAEASLLLHTLQHCVFLFTALLFWWSLLKPGRHVGAAVLCLFVTMLHTGALGALLTFSGVVWYPASTAAAGHWGLTPIEDQQLGGLIMWVPGGIPYLAAALILATRLLRTDERMQPAPKDPRNIPLRLDSR